MTTERYGFFLTICSAAGFATLAILIKLAYDTGANTSTIMTGRFAFASCLMWLTINARGIRPVIESRTLAIMLAAATIFYVVMSNLFALSLHYLPAGLAGIILYTYPALVAMLSALLGDEALNRRKLSALAICFSGLVLTLGVTFQTVDIRGIWLGLGAAAVFATYIVLSNRILKTVHPLVASTYICTASAVILCILAVSSGSFQYNLPWASWLVIAAISIFATYVGVLFFLEGISRIGAPTASIVSTIEPALTVLLSVAFLGEQLTLLQIFGGLLILSGILVLQLPASRQPSSSMKANV